MKKKILIGLLSAGMLFGLCSCDIEEDATTNQGYYVPQYNKVIIQLPNGESFEGELEDYSFLKGPEGGIRVDLHGVSYYTHLENVILIAE